MSHFAPLLDQATCITFDVFTAVARQNYRTVLMLLLGELRRVPGGRPAEVETQWSEITSDGVAGGTYAIVRQGARISEVRYLRQHGKLFRFEEDLDASTDQGCDWQK